MQYFRIWLRLYYLSDNVKLLETIYNPYAGALTTALQLPFLWNVSFDKHIALWGGVGRCLVERGEKTLERKTLIFDLNEKKPPKP